MASESVSFDKYDVIIRGLRGEPEEQLCAEFGISLEVYRGWVEQFLESGRKGLADESEFSEPVSNFVDLVRSIPHAVFCKDLDGRFIYANPAYCEALKVDPVELVGRNDFDIHTTEVAEKYRADDMQVVVTGKVFSCQEKNEHMDGTVLWVEVVKAPLRDEAGRIIGTMGMFWDISRQKRIEKELRDSQENLEFMVGKRTHELLEANQRLENGARLQNDFMSAISHELRTPLTSILGFSKLIRRDVGVMRDVVRIDLDYAKRLMSKVTSNAEIITSEGSRLKRLIDDLLDLDKISSGNMSWTDHVFDLNDVAKASVDAMRGHFASKPEVELVYEQSPLPILILADKDRVMQVFINLLNNAAKFTDKGRVSVEVSVRDQKWAEATVVDTGLGISEEEIAHIFEDYYQGAQPFIHEKGTGLGLSICNQIISHYGGKFWAESMPGHGTTFYFLLPLQDDESVV